MRAETVLTDRARQARPFLALVVGLQVMQLAVLVFLPHPALASSLLQLLTQVLAAWVCFSQIRFLNYAAGRLCWTAVGTAFCLRSIAHALSLLSMSGPLTGHFSGALDNAFSFAFGLPLLLAVNTFSEQSVDRVLWLDRLQATFFLVVLYLLVFLPAVHLNADTALLIQDVALLLCCLLRLPAARTGRQLRFFLRICAYLLVSAPCAVAGHLLRGHGWPPGSMLDLCWTVPTTFFCVLVLWHEISPWDPPKTSKVVMAIRSLQGFSVTSLPVLSMAVSGYLAMRVPALGGVCIAFAFGVFALRTNTREREWLYTHDRLQETVLQDALTGLGNRVQLRKSLAERLVSAPKVSCTVLLFVDLDRFKAVNDSLGHAWGDHLLISVADRLRAASSPDSVVCRLGGDEFVVLTSAEDLARAQARGEALLAALHVPFRLGEHLLRCTASIGVVLAKGSESVDDMLRTADHAMYRAKQLGKDRVQVFDASLLQQMTIRWQMEADLRDAVEEGDIEVAFQPILGMEHGQITGFEALARWSHPDKGEITPSEFIPLAEDTGLILALGAQVLEKACYQVAEWNHRWHTRFTVSVNVSPRQFADSNLLAAVLATLNRTGLEPSLLRLEITESALLVHEATIRQALAEARAHGIRISLDDFGTGYSSLSFLLTLPVDEVKIDRSFVSDMTRDPQRKELVRTVVQLSHSLGKRVVAEGVETEQELAELAAMGCECAQGWLIGRPMLPDAIEAEMPSITTRNTRSLAFTQEADGQEAVSRLLREEWHRRSMATMERVS